MAALNSNHGNPAFLFETLGMAFLYVGIIPLFLVITDLFRREYGPDQRALVSWVSFGVSMAVVALAGTYDRIYIPLFGALCGGGTWAAIGLVIQHHRANLRPRRPIRVIGREAQADPAPIPSPIAPVDGSEEEVGSWRLLRARQLVEASQVAGRSGTSAGQPIPCGRIAATSARILPALVIDLLAESSFAVLRLTAAE